MTTRKTISVKITPRTPLWQHFPDGRAVAIQISSDNGVNEDVEVMVNVPKTYWLEPSGGTR